MTHTKLLFPAVALALIAFLAGPAGARTRHRANRSSADTTFVTHAAEGGMAEVQMAQFALSKSTNQTVKDLANKIETD